LDQDFYIFSAIHTKEPKGTLLGPGGRRKRPIGQRCAGAGVQESIPEGDSILQPEQDQE